MYRVIGSVTQVLHSIYKNTRLKYTPSSDDFGCFASDAFLNSIYPLLAYEEFFCDLRFSISMHQQLGYLFFASAENIEQMFDKDFCVNVLFESLSCGDVLRDAFNADDFDAIARP